MISIGEYITIIQNCSSTQDLKQVEEFFTEFVDEYSKFEVIIITDKIQQQKDKLL